MDINSTKEISQYELQGGRKHVRKVYITAQSQLGFWLLLSGGDGGDDSEGVDEADRGVYDGLLVTVYLGGREGGSSVEEEGGIPLGQADSQALVQVPDLVRLLLSGVSGKS